MEIIAELGTLHLGSYNGMLRATERALKHAHAVKTQLINPETAFWATEKRKKELKKITWTLKIWAKFFKYANANLGPTFASLFDPVFFEPEITQPMPAIKLGHRANLIAAVKEKALKENKTLLVSVANNQERKDYHEVCNLIRPINQPKLFFLFVQPQYPTLAEEVRLPLFASPENTPNGYHGLSCHADKRQIEIAKAASFLGARFFEIHVQDKKNAQEGPDSQLAITLEELAELRYELDSLEKGFSGVRLKDNRGLFFSRKKGIEKTTNHEPPKK